MRHAGIIATIAMLGMATSSPAWSVTSTGPGASAAQINYRDYQSGISTFINGTSYSANGTSASIDVTNGPTLSVNGSSSGFIGATLNYSFYISGPSGVTNIPFDIYYTYQLVGITGPQNPSGNPAAASIHFSYTGGTPTFPVSVNTNAANASVSGNVSTLSATGTAQVTAADNTALLVQLQVGANGAGSSGFLDPQFYIDPSFFALNTQYTASQFTIQESAGVANGVTSALPEPGSLVAACGMAFAILTQKRRRL